MYQLTAVVLLNFIVPNPFPGPVYRFVSGL